MIDIDKYEGHTPAPWSIKTGNAGHSVKDANGDHVCTIPDPIGMCNKHIIADAPLLLAEVKRLDYLLDESESRLRKEMDKNEELEMVLGSYEADPETTGGMLEDSRAELKRLYEEVDSLEIAIASMQKEIKQLREAFITAVRHVGEHDLSRDDLFSKLDEDLFSYWLLRSEKE
tara:strand:- start:62 stop:580 length:519 start_codon:yes stop_codon:yes gene_type:complete